MGLAAHRGRRLEEGMDRCPSAREVHHPWLVTREMTFRRTIEGSVSKLTSCAGRCQMLLRMLVWAI